MKFFNLLAYTALIALLSSHNAEGIYVFVRRQGKTCSLSAVF
ncbi:20613_t:CDS:1, partial [Racocetra persica]